MPVVVVALAASSFIGAAAAATAVGATMATMVCAGAVMVGSALTIVGTITGNKKLTKIGAIVGLVGGIGGAVNGMMEAGATAAAEEGAKDVAGELAQGTATDAAASATTDAAAGAATGVATDAATDAASSALTTSPVTPPGGIEPVANTSVVDPTSSLVKPVSASAPATTPMQGAIDANTNMYQSPNSAANQVQAFKTPSPFDGNANVAQGDYLGSIETGAQPTTGFNVPSSDPSMLSKMDAWAKANPELAKAALNGVAGAAGKLIPSEADKAMMERYRQQTENDKRRALWGSGRTA